MTQLTHDILAICGQWFERYCEEREESQRIVRENKPEAIGDFLKQQAIGDFLKQREESLLEISGAVARIKISGPLSRTGPDFFDILFGFGGTSYDKIADAIIEADEDPNVERIELLMNTPGGTVDGVDVVVRALRDVRTTKKTTAINVGLLASSGYWIAAQCDEIQSASASCEVGSVGVVITSYAQDASSRRVRILSRNAPLKNADASTESGLAELQRRADAIERVMFAEIANGRRTTAEEIASKYGRGGVLISIDPDPEQNDGIKSGMIDKVLYMPNKSVVLSPDKTAIETAETAEESDEMDEKILQLEKELSAVKAELTSAKARISAVIPCLGSAEYHESIKGLAVKVLTGDDDPAALRGAIIAFDAMRESKVEAAAIEESAGLPEVPRVESAASEDGTIEGLDDIKRAAERLRALQGR